MRQSSLLIPLVLIIVGAIWFLKSTHILPPTATLLAIGLAVGGTAVLVMDGINKQSIVSGLLLIYIGTAVYLKSQYIFDQGPLIALGLMVTGCLMLLARSSLIPPKYSAHGLRYRRKDGGE